MASEREQRRQAYVEKTRSEVASLVECGVRMGGNAFSPVLLAKGELTPEEAAGAKPFSGPDGAALKAGMQLFLLTDCLINKKDVDISAIPHGSWPQLMELLGSLREQ